jgi:multidrug efflux pump subunit AcrB
VLVGLACKNAILIVEFAQDKHGAGLPVLEATREAAQLRLRPILMTSFAFILGVVPLVYASGVLRPRKLEWAADYALRGRRGPERVPALHYS